MASPILSKAVAGIQTVLVHFQSVTAGVANRALFRLPQKSQILRIGASYRVSLATDVHVMVEAGGTNLLSSSIDMILAAPTDPVAVENPINGNINLGTHSWVVSFVTATGESVGSAKSNVLTLAAPSAPTAAENPIGGAVNLGAHSFKVTFVNAGGESVASAKSNVITLAAPAAPTAAEVVASGNVTLGTHSYKVTLVSAGGESVVSAKSNVVTLAAPTAADAAENPVNGAVELGAHSYKVTFVSPAGESVASAKSAVVTLAAPTAPTVAENPVNGSVELGAHSYKVTFTNAGGESVASAKSAVVTLAAPTAPTGTLAGAGAGNVNNGTHSYKVTFVNAGGESVASVKSNVVTVVDLGADGQINVTAIPVGPAGTTERKLYRSAAGDAGPWLLVPTGVTLQDNVTTAVVDNTADGGLGAAAPAATGGRISLADIPVGPAGTTGRKLYRTVTGDGGDHKLLATIANNVDTVYEDNAADGTLGAAAPAATGGRIALSNIPLGPAGTTARKVYRTITGDGGNHLLLTTINDNATTVYADNSADGALGAAVSADTGTRVGLTGVPTGPAGTLSRNIYRTVTGDAGDWLLVGAIADNVTTTFSDNVADGGLGVAAPTPTGGRLALTGIPLGPAGTTARKVYRTDAGDAGAWKLVGTISDNTTTTLADNLADGAGAAAPTGTGSRATVTIPTGPSGTTSRRVFRTDAGDAGDHKLVGTVANNTATSFADNVADGAGAAAPTSDTRLEGNYSEGTLVEAVAAAIAKETEITVDVDTMTGSVSDLCVQIDLVRMD